MNPKKTRLQMYEEIQAMVRKDARDEATKVYKELATRTGVARVPLHEHNGLDTPKIPAASVVPGLRALGTITFMQSATYRLGITFEATQLNFYGAAFFATTEFTFDDPVSVDNGDIYEDEASGALFTVASNQTNTTITMTGLGASAGGGTLILVSGTGDSPIDYTGRTNTVNYRTHSVGEAQLTPSFYWQPETPLSVTAGSNLHPIIQGSTNLQVTTTGPAFGSIVSDSYICTGVTENLFLEVTGYGRGFVELTCTLPGDGRFIIGTIFCK